ncbi:MAG: hypothetical protein U0531_20160, partial [Dehalococcoidia bacterium]
MSRWHDLRLTPKLMIAFLVLGLAPLAVVGGFADHAAATALHKDATGSLEETAFNASDKLDRNLFERYGDVQAFALSRPARSMQPDQIITWMNTMMGAYAPVYTLMVVADTQGRIIATNEVDQEGKPLPAARRLHGRDVSGERWFRDGMSGAIKDGASLVEDLRHDTLVAEVYGTAGGADLAMSFTAPIKDSDGRIVGVWSNRFNWQVATTIVRDVEQRAWRSGARSLRVGLVNASGISMIDPHADDILTESVQGAVGLAQLPVQGAAVTGHGDGIGLESK